MEKNNVAERTRAGKVLPLAILLALTALSMSSVWFAQRLTGFGGFIVTTGGALISLVISLYVWSNWYRAEIDLASLKGWRYAAAIAAADLLVTLLFNSPSLGAFSAGGALFWAVWFTAFTGILEEFWWRGVWFYLWRGRPFVTIVAGSALFGCLHLVQNSLASVVVISSIGLLFGVARHKGASIGSLALVHGLTFNWLNETILKWESRALFGEAYEPFARACVYAAAAGLMYFALPEKKAQSVLPQGSGV
ncbi:MAG: CPBP family intramembrane glutamic endopeptidase [Elusimicrobiales bacterium]